MITTDEMLLRHTLAAMDKILENKILGPQQLSRRPPAQEGSTTAADSRTAGVGILSAKTRLEALMLAKMNEEHAELCDAEHPAIRTLLEMNAKFLRSIAQ